MIDLMPLKSFQPLSSLHVREHQIRQVRDKMQTGFPINGSAISGRTLGEVVNCRNK
jgi:hypothetical protein